MHNWLFTSNEFYLAGQSLFIMIRQDIKFNVIKKTKLSYF